MPGVKDKKRFPWGCTIRVDTVTEFPTSAVITHVRNCGCPGPDDEGAVFMILARACLLHESNVVKYMIPVVNNMAKEAAAKIGVRLDRGIDHLPMYKDRVEWRDGLCIENLGRGFTTDELKELGKLPKGQRLGSWLI